MREIKALYEQYSADVYRFALYLCGDQSVAEDITADTFTRLLTHKSEVITETVKAYLLTIARNLFLEHKRRESRYQDTPTQETLGQSLEASFLEHKQIMQVFSILQSLNVNDRALLLLRAEGVTYEDISKILGISQAAAKVKIHRLRKNMIIKFK